MKINFILFLLMAGTFFQNARSQPEVQPPQIRAQVYYFHPTERCPIDQTIEENTRKLVRSDFAVPVRDGLLRLQVINTDDKASARIAGQFEINTQALYVVTYKNGKEVSRKDLTEFAFSNAQSNPSRFRSVLKEEITQALKK